jgi:predicted ester cyclase
MSLRSFFQEYFDQIWAGRDPEGITQRRGMDTHSAGLGARSLSDADYRRFHALVLETFPRGVVVRIDDAIEDGERIAMRLHLVGTTATGREIRARGMAFARVRDGKIVEADNLFDVASVLVEAGVLAQSAAPLDAALRALS